MAFLIGFAIGIVAGWRTVGLAANRSRHLAFTYTDPGSWRTVAVVH